MEITEKMREVLERLAKGEISDVNLSNCFFERFPENILDFGEIIEWFDLQHNRLSEIPKEIAQLRKLRILNLSHNLLTELPSEIGALENLRVLNLRENNLTKLPPEIKHLQKIENFLARFTFWLPYLLYFSEGQAMVVTSSQK